MKNLFLSLVIFAISTATFGQLNVENKINPKQKTICNPVNLSYRFCLDSPSRREAADPVIVLYKNEYYLFASKSGGYWHSTNLMDWNLITTPDLPLEDYAPAVVVMDNALYFMASGPSPVSIYKTTNPKMGKWEVANAAFPIGNTDPDLFLDDDGRLYFYYGCSDKDPIYAVELDRKTLNPKGMSVNCFNSNKEDYGWEQPGNYNNKPERPWIEGAWMTKHKGKYYLQYAGPGTEFKSYSDGLYTSGNPLGPFKLAAHNPISLKPEGFITGAGHSSTFQDKYGNYWHISTMTLSQKHPFERRLGLFPMFFDKDNMLYAYTGFGDFPIFIPQKKITSPAELFPKWMLLSYNKPITVSSALTDFPKENAIDEEIRTYWSAKTGNKGEWVIIDLQKKCTINAVQINYAENQTKLFNRSPGIYHQYLLEYSDDKVLWKVLENKTTNKQDVPHDYIELATPIKARFVRLTNFYVPDGTFALAGLRVFGKATGQPPKLVTNFKVLRTGTDRREVKLQWDKSQQATGYNIRYGIQPDKLYQNYQVLTADLLTIRSLNKFQKYYFTIDTFNENGITKGTQVIEVN